MFKILILFKGVYIEVYKIKFARPKLAAIPLTPQYKIPIPVRLDAAAKVIA